MKRAPDHRRIYVGALLNWWDKEQGLRLLALAVAGGVKGTSPDVVIDLPLDIPQAPFTLAPRVDLEAYCVRTSPYADMPDDNGRGVSTVHPGLLLYLLPSNFGTLLRGKTGIGINSCPSCGAFVTRRTFSSQPASRFKCGLGPDCFVRNLSPLRGFIASADRSYAGTNNVRNRTRVAIERRTPGQKRQYSDNYC